jgi:hypothetical protein
MTLLFATSVALAWLPQSDVSNRHHQATPIYHLCCLSMIAQSDVSKSCHEDTGEWFSSPHLLSRHGCPNQTWATRTNGRLLCFNGWTFTKIALRSCVKDSLLSRKTVHCHWSSYKCCCTLIWLKQSTIHSFENAKRFVTVFYSSLYAVNNIR